MDFAILGPLEIRQDGRSLACRGTKRRLLLAALLLHPNEVVSSDRLIEALWGEHPPPTAQKALQVHVSQLRRLLAAGSDGDPIVTRPPGYELRLAEGDLDLERFEAGVAAARAASAHGHVEQASALFGDALALWRGAPLADLSFEDFLQPEIARLEELRLAALEDRIEADLALGRHPEMIGELESLAAEHPLRERIQGQLMLALYRSGRQAEALEVHRGTRRRLVDELGLEPGRELRELEARILAQDEALDRPTRSEPNDLIGREQEIASLAPLVDDLRSGRGALALIGGEPGIGKSRLAETLARRAERQGARVAVGRCWEAGGAPPFWPWIQALRTLVGRSDAGALPELLADAGVAAPRDAQAARFMMFDSIAGLLRDTAAAAPVAIFLDDIHAADASSLLLLRFIAAELTDAAVVVVCCYRDTEIGAELAATLAELSRVPAVHRIAVKGLDAAATSRLLAETMPDPPPDELAIRVHAETHGNPLFAAELGRLFATEGLPADAAQRLPIPEGVREAIRRRLQRQSSDCRDVLALASVAGREFELATLLAVSDVSDATVSAAIDEAGAARLVGPVPGSDERLRFSHILVRDALYEDLPARTRRQLHLDVGNALESLHGGDARRASELAHHYLAAGSAGSVKAIEAARQAGHAAASQHAYEEAAGWFATALELVAGDPRTTCDLLLALGEAQSRAGSGAESRATFRRAAAIAEEQGWPEALARAAIEYGGRFAWARASTDPGLVPLLERALAALGEDGRITRAQLLARLAAAKRDEPGREARVRYAEEALAIGRAAGDPLTLAFALEGYWVAAEDKDPVEGISIGDQLIALGEELGDKERVFEGHDYRLNAFWKLADRAAVDVEIEVLAGLADEVRQPAQSWHAATAQTALALLEGRFDDGERLIDQTRRGGERATSWNAEVSARLQLFVLARARGRLADMEDTLRRSAHEYPALLRFRCALAHTLAELGVEKDARTLLDDLLAGDIAHEYVDAEWLLALCMLPDVTRFLGDKDAAAVLYDALAPWPALYAQAPGEMTFGAVARGLGVLASVLGRLDDAAAHLEAAIEIERTMRARPWAAHARHDLATVLRARDAAGDRERAAQLLGEATTAYTSLGMTSWAARAQALAAS